MIIQYLVWFGYYLPWQASDSNKQRVADMMGTSDYQGGSSTPVTRRSASKNHLNDSMSSLNSVNSDGASEANKQAGKVNNS